MVDNAELAFYRALASFSYNSSISFSNSQKEAQNLYIIVQQLIIFCNSQYLQIPDALVNLLALTINSTLRNDRQLRTPQITNHALHIIYDTIKLLYDNNINLWSGINSTLFNQKYPAIFIFPGQPRRQGWEFVFGQFAFFDSRVPKQFPLQEVQHVVHDIDNVVTILQTFSGKAHFKGFPNNDYSGPPLCWFAPLPPPWENERVTPCDSLDPFGSRYGCYRFILPFKILIQHFPTCFVLGTRKYNQEHSHTILLTKQGVAYITLIETCMPVQLTDTIFIQSSRRSSQTVNMEESFEWLCFHDDPQKKWDQLEFAIATKDLVFDPFADKIRLDFVDHHSKLCVPSLKTPTSCRYKWNKHTAMQQFLVKLHERNIELGTFSAFFTDEVWNELMRIKQSMRWTI